MNKGLGCAEPRAGTWELCREPGDLGFCPVFLICSREISHDKLPHWQLEFENWSGSPSIIDTFLPFHLLLFS